MSRTDMFILVTLETCLSSEDIARQSCAMVPKWRIFASCISSKPRAVHAACWKYRTQKFACSTFQTCILNSH